ncbi:MAG: hypothetical protein WBF17_24380, partial [Phycisphaerae bacterium]
NVPVAVGLAFAILAPALSVALSLIRSPGADTHAAHVGQPRLGRIAGIVGTVLVAFAMGGVALCFGWARSAIRDGGGRIPYAFAWLVVALIAPTSLLALAATAMGAIVVHRAEKTAHRPSAFARISAGLGVMGVGACIGLLIPMLVFIRGILFPASQPAEEQEAVTEMTWVSYAVLTGMLGLLVAGLAWCFYRAAKAAGAEAPEQVSEGMD